MTEELSVEDWLAIRRAEGLKIDPETAEVFWKYGQIVDPYGIYPDLQEEEKCIGRVNFACAPGSEVWVCFDDLPIATAVALLERHEAELEFPAGLNLESLDRRQLEVEAGALREEPDTVTGRKNP